MKLVVAPEAAAQILVRKRWWRKNRSKAPERFDDELAAALAAITESPEFPFSPQVLDALSGAACWCHLYFEVLSERQEVWVLAARGAAQRRRPRLSSR
jgi:hypothetical protein